MCSYDVYDINTWLLYSDPHGVLAPDSLRMSSASTTTCNSSVFNSTGFLPTVEEERELRLDPVLTTPSKGSVQSLQSIVKTPQGASTSLSSRMVQLDSSFPPPASSSRTARLKANELHPSLMSSVAATAVPDIRSASYAYHANSSNWNPVSRQDSELQSQSSGAVGKLPPFDKFSGKAASSSICKCLPIPLVPLIGISSIIERSRVEVLYHSSQKGQILSFKNKMAK